MNVGLIIKQFINDNGFDGLVNCHIECGCDKDDLAPCGQPNFTHCEAAYKTLKDSEVVFTKIVKKETH